MNRSANIALHAAKTGGTDHLAVGSKQQAVKKQPITTTTITTQMTNNRLLLAPLLIGLWLLTSCHEEPDVNCEYGFTQATVVFTGAPEVDGCGWKIQIGEVLYNPVVLIDSFKIDNLPVLIKFKPDGEDFHCGRGGTIYQSIQITEIRKHGRDVRVLPENAWDSYSMDPFRLDSAYVDGDILMMHVGYSGGCRQHDFILWKLPPNALNPPPVELALSHESNGDTCEGYLHSWLVFSLVPLRENGKREIRFLLRGSPEMSAYFGEFVYKY
jgi:hypothetical protein